jgi:hypothetical protein
LPVLTYSSKTGAFIANPQALIYENEVFELLADARTSIADVLVDQTDYRSLLRQADPSDSDRINHLTNRHALRALAKPVDRQLNTAFAALFEA